MIRQKYCKQGRKVTAHNVNLKLKDENLIEVVVTSHGGGAGEAGADIDDEYISRTAQHQPPPASQLYNSHAKEEGETVEGYNQQPTPTVDLDTTYEDQTSHLLHNWQL